MVPFSIQEDECNAGTYYQFGTAIWIDYNQNGSFSDPGELAFVEPAILIGPRNITGNITIPCSALLGETRMRITIVENSAGGALTPCLSYGYGETEDYIITIQDNPMVYVSNTATQNSGLVAPGTTDAQVLRVPVIASGCGAETITEIFFNTAGTTAPSDIVNAKLYATGASPVFNNTKLLGTVSSPSGQFTFTGLADTLIGGTGDTNNYWLTYDITGTLGNVIDARLDSINAIGAYRLPINGDPSGSRLIDVPMAYVSSDVSQASVARVGKGTILNKMLKYEVVTSPTGSPINASSFEIATTGTDSLPDITNLQVWYTGASSAFATTTPFGTAVAVPAATQTVTGVQQLLNGANYFWVTYDIISGATSGHNVDGEITSALIGGAPQIPSVMSPSGARQIRDAYCTPTYTSAAFSSPFYGIYNVSTTGGSTNLNNLNTGVTGASNNYNNYQSQEVAVSQNNSFTITVSTPSGYNGFAIWIDYNQDGTLNNTNERVYMSPNSNVSFTTTITIPCDALIGQTLLRIRTDDFAVPSDACNDFGYGETEDYTIDILPNPVVISSTNSLQFSGVAAPGSINRKVLRVPVKTAGCGDGVVTEFRFSTTGTTNASDITAAKLYGTW
jgi:hypothetical protein